MSQGEQIRGMAWDHPRALNPLNAISEQWSRDRDLSVSWEARPLKDFEDQPLEELASTFDLVLMDYPFVGTAAESGLIAPVDYWVDAAYLRDQADHSVGPSYDSYTWSGQQWALAIDAATQVSAVRADLLAAAGLAHPPQTWNGVAELVHELKDGALQVAIPLNPNHAYCAFLSVGLAMLGTDFWPKGKKPNRETALDALDFLIELAPALHPMSQSSDPIAISDQMANSDEILFVPLMFGYSNYARPGFRRHSLRFGNAPRGESGHIGSVLGGVGIALSALSSQRELAAELARLMVSADMQSGLYVQSGGQPGHGAAWESRAANDLVDDFFFATRETMDQAFMRPRVPGHRQFQEEAGILVNRTIWDQGRDAESCLDCITELADRLLGRWE
jgi:multiple sugar transport system substrate-binding protein